MAINLTDTQNNAGITLQGQMGKPQTLSFTDTIMSQVSPTQYGQNLSLNLNPMQKYLQAKNMISGNNQQQYYPQQEQGSSDDPRLYQKKTKADEIYQAYAGLLPLNALGNMGAGYEGTNSILDMLRGK